MSRYRLPVPALAIAISRPYVKLSSRWCHQSSRLIKGPLQVECHHTDLMALFFVSLIFSGFTSSLIGSYAIDLDLFVLISFYWIFVVVVVVSVGFGRRFGAIYGSRESSRIFAKMPGILSRHSASTFYVFPDTIERTEILEPNRTGNFHQRSRVIVSTAATYFSTHLHPQLRQWRWYHENMQLKLWHGLPASNKRY